ncbi:MAG: hypothetical protein KBC22_01330 [Candidatus Pacebacteria bacterium]|nr:hypothetical protein [Candidatus Paceibacterota bacterium]
MKTLFYVIVFVIKTIITETVLLVPLYWRNLATLVFPKIISGSITYQLLVFLEWWDSIPLIAIQLLSTGTLILIIILAVPKYYQGFTQTLGKILSKVTRRLQSLAKENGPHLQL